MFEVTKRYAGRIARAKERLAAAWRGENTDRPAFILSDVNYALCGQRDIPDEYFDPAVMFAYQRDKIQRHMDAVPDDYIPVFHPWYGTTVVPSALGARVRWQRGMDPAIEGAVVNSPGDVQKLEPPRFETDGDMPRVLACIDYFTAHTDAPVCVTDCQGPLSTALALAGPQNLFLWMVTAPAAVHGLMDFCTEALIGWVRAQKRRMNQPDDAGAFPHAIALPAGCGGVAFSDDDIVAIKAKHFEEFVKPYNERLLAAFGGGTLHFCGSARQQLQNLAELGHCTGINNFCMLDYEQARLLRCAFLGRGAVMACDFNTADIPRHCRALKDAFAEDPRGLVVGVFTAPDMALGETGYEQGRDSGESIIQGYLEGLAEWLN